MTETTNAQAPVTDVLRQQHEYVKQLFSEFGPASGSNRSALFDCIRATLAVHETAEEMIVYPALRSTGDEGKGVADARLEEESKAKQVLSDLEKTGVGGEGFDATFEQFRTSVLQHAEAEESQVFPLLEQHLDAKKLADMGDAVQKAEKMAPTHPHPHGPEGAVGNMVVGPFVAMVDKVRDALADKRKAS